MKKLALATGILAALALSSHAQVNDIVSQGPSTDRMAEPHGATSDADRQAEPQNSSNTDRMSEPPGATRDRTVTQEPPGTRRDSPGKKNARRADVPIAPSNTDRMAEPHGATSDADRQAEPQNSSNIDRMSEPPGATRDRTVTQEPPGTRRDSPGKKNARRADVPIPPSNTDRMAEPPGTTADADSRAEPDSGALPDSRDNWSCGVVRISYYGKTSAAQGQSLQIRWMAENGFSGIEIAGGNSGDLALLAVGFDRENISLGVGDALRVRPTAVIPVGLFDAHGKAQLALDANNELLTGTTVNFQAFEQLKIDPYPWTIATSAGMAVTFLGG